MANAAVVRCAWAPTGGQSVSLRRIAEPSVAKDQHGESEALFGLAAEAYGYSDDVRPSYRISFNVPVTVGAQEYDWSAAADAREEGQFTYAVGIIAHVYEAKVVSCEEATDGMRKNTWTVTLLARTRRRI